MGEQQRFLGLLPWNTSPWWLSCHFLIVLSSRAAVCGNSCSHIISEARALPVQDISGGQRQPLPQQKGSPCLHKGGKESCSINKLTKTFRALSELSAAFLLSPCERIFPISCCYYRAVWKGSCCALTSFCKGTVSHEQNCWLGLFILAMAHCTGSRAFNCCCEEHLFYVKHHRRNLTLYIISYRYCNVPPCTPCQNICNQVHLTENLA